MNKINVLIHKKIIIGGYMRLYVIGNGFDLAHAMATTYGDFRKYLVQNKVGYVDKLEMDYGIGISDTSDPIKDLWQDFETMLGEHNGYSIGEDDSYNDLGLECEIGKYEIAETDLNEKYHYVSLMNELLSEWIESIKLSTKKTTSKLSGDDHLFLSFNYTLLLESLYKIDRGRILHIHGSISEYDYEPVIGHGNKQIIKEMKREAVDFEYDVIEDEKTGVISVTQRDGDEDRIRSIQYKHAADFLEALEKDVQKYIVDNKAFFERLNVIDEVHIVGHSLGEVDMPYLKQIVDATENEVDWIMWYYKECKMTDLDVSELLIKYEHTLNNIGVSNSKIKFRESNNFFDL